MSKLFGFQIRVLSRLCNVSMKSCDRRTNTRVLRLTINSGRPIRPHSRSRECHHEAAALADRRATAQISACRSISFRLRHKVLLKHIFSIDAAVTVSAATARKAIGFAAFYSASTCEQRKPKVLEIQSSKSARLLPSLALLWFSRLIVFIVVSCALAANRDGEKAMNQRWWFREIVSEGKRSVFGWITDCDGISFSNRSKWRYDLFSKRATSSVYCTRICKARVALTFDDCLLCAWDSLIEVEPTARRRSMNSQMTIIKSIHNV